MIGRQATQNEKLLDACTCSPTAAAAISQVLPPPPQNLVKSEINFARASNMATTARDSKILVAHRSNVLAQI